VDKPSDTLSDDMGQGDKGANRQNTEQRYKRRESNGGICAQRFVQAPKLSVCVIERVSTMGE